MPTLKTFANFSIRMFMNDHEPAHVHVWIKGGPQAQMAIEDGELLRGRLPRAVERDARAWVLANREALRAMWRNYRRP